MVLTSLWIIISSAHMVSDPEKYSSSFLSCLFRTLRRFSNDSISFLFCSSVTFWPSYGSINLVKASHFGLSVIWCHLVSLSKLSPSMFSKSSSLIFGYVFLKYFMICSILDIILNFPWTIIGRQSAGFSFFLKVFLALDSVSKVSIYLSI